MGRSFIFLFGQELDWSITQRRMYGLYTSYQMFLRRESTTMEISFRTQPGEMQEFFKSLNL